MTASVYKQFEELFHSLYSELCNYAYHFLKNDAEAEDVVQETFINIWQKHRDIINADMKYYLYRAVRNNSISMLRKRNNAEAENKALSYIQDGEQEPDVWRQKESGPPNQKALIAEAIASLPPQCREVFTCCKLRSMSYQQTADHMGLSVKTVENYMGRALKLLREYLKKYGLPASLILLIKMLNF
jgi:RNA polymerase sigma-70 factor (family 1)